jgi:hypothetical protein
VDGRNRSGTRRRLHIRAFEQGGMSAAERFPVGLSTSEASAAAGCRLSVGRLLRRVFRSTETTTDADLAVMAERDHRSGDGEVSGGRVVAPFSNSSMRSAMAVEPGLLVLVRLDLPKNLVLGLKAL